MTQIKIEKVNKSYGKNLVLRDISFEVKDAELLTLLGPSGCGKSTLLRIIAGLTDLDKGSVFFDGNSITETAINKRGIGMVFQHYSLFPNMTVLGNVVYALKHKYRSKSERIGKAREVLSLVGMHEYETRYPSQLSGGQQQRTALARAIVMEPRVLLLDEPLSAIDAKLRRELQIEIKNIQKRLGITMIFVTHDQEEAMILSDKICLMRDGRLVQMGSPAELYKEPNSHFSATFIGNYNILESHEYAMLTGNVPTHFYYALRPELIKVGKLEGFSTCISKITSITSHGNITRYSVESKGIFLNIDMLTDNSYKYEIGDDLCISIEKDTIIPLSE